MERLYREEGAESAVDKGLWREILRIINEGTVEGLSQAAAPPAHDEQFYRELRHSNEVFAAFKAHTMADEMAAKLYDAGGHLKPFRIWERDVSSIKSHQVGSWLRTEYDTAVIRAHNAADWREFERNKDVMPNLRWMPTTSPEPDSVHSRYWKARLTLPVGHPFWDMHRPGDRWNCKCSLEATDEPATPEALDGMEDVKPQRGLENNPGKDGHTFSDSHPYFPKDCRHCFAYRNSGFKNRLKGWFKNQQKDCYNCQDIDNLIQSNIRSLKELVDVEPPYVSTYTTSNGGNIFTSPYHGEDEKDENVRLAVFIHEKLGKKVYLLPRLDPKNAEQAALRPILHPDGVIPNKNPDYMIGGLLFDGKSMMNVEQSGNTDKYHEAILNRVKAAKRQADNAILEIPPFISRRIINNTIGGFLKQSHKNRIIIVKHGEKCYIYKKRG
ncbi:hypothetical protein E5358_04875 [Palleniella muris]|uniref:Uncharacterized protein n=1 Tax=Palleniella muris TaxID=3038145 RepID=A0AC61QRS9_9BACT|nr:hypothetical protein [Palleniella muris]TGX82997.1 hypothetical protein E5358_04875 [Palleniella muris]